MDGEKWSKQYKKYKNLFFVSLGIACIISFLLFAYSYYWDFYDVFSLFLLILLLAIFFLILFFVILIIRAERHLTLPEGVHRKFPPEAKFLIGLISTVVIILAVILSYLELNYKTDLKIRFLIVLPIAIFLGIFCLYYLYKKM